MRVSTGFGFRRFGRRARRWCSRHHIDIVHSFTLAFPGDIYHACAGVFATMNVQAQASGSRQNTSPWKRMMIGISGKQRTLLTLEKRALDATAPRRPRLGMPPRVISLCDVMTEQMQHFYHIAADRIVQLPTPRMDPAGSNNPLAAAAQRAWFRAHYQLEETDRVALFVGHDFRRKGLRFAIEAIAKTTTRWKLLVVGLGKAREYVELADALGIGDQAVRREQRILFVGPTRDMNRIYAAADALVLPTFYDSFGLVVMEAFAHGLPVITTENLGARELVRAHNAGTIVPTPQSIDAIAQALDNLPLPGTQESADLSARARAAGAGISPGEFIDKLLALYQTISQGNTGLVNQEQLILFILLPISGLSRSRLEFPLPG